jgi:geranylgeranyl diphosphate synthase type II
LYRQSDPRKLLLQLFGSDRAFANLARLRFNRDRTGSGHSRLDAEREIGAFASGSRSTLIRSNKLGRAHAGGMQEGHAYCGCYTFLSMLKDILEQGRIVTDQALERLLPPGSQYPPSIHQAMRHSVFAGGKRLRPILCMEAAQMVDGCVPAGIEELGAALEMLHTYSLIHDDLPALDNDDLRRGRPTCHKAFGEATAILAGDALQTYAYEVLAKLQCSADARVAIIADIAQATGTINGMIGGQVMDLEAERQHPDAKTLEYIHRSKTGALLTASVVSGGLYAGADASQIQSLRDFGQNIGLAFQIVDDVLDVTQTSEQLGKTAGKDTATEKATYPSLFGVEESIKKADYLVARASAALDPFGEKAATLREIAHFLVERKK